MTEHPKQARIGVRIPIRTVKGGDTLPGWKAAAYDVDTGAELPAQSVDLHMRAGEIVSATITLFPYEVTIGDPQEQASDE